jgi:hypothetical protein
MGIYNGKIKGILRLRQTAIGTRSEGPAYFINPIDEYKKWNEIPIRKCVLRWMKDPVLDNLIDKEIVIEGEITETKDTISIEYTQVFFEEKCIPAHKKSGKVVISEAKRDELIKDFIEKANEK